MCKENAHTKPIQYIELFNHTVHVAVGELRELSSHAVSVLYASTPPQKSFKSGRIDRIPCGSKTTGDHNGRLLRDLPIDARH